MTQAEQDSNKISQNGRAERRTSLQLRAVFEDACQITTALFDAHQSLGGESSLRLFAHRTLHEAYPDFTLQDISLLVSGVMGHHMARLKKVER